MPSLKDIRRRIGSVKNTQKITRAMKLVSAAKFARANQAVVAARPYGAAFDSMVARLVKAAQGEIASPLIEERPEKRALVAVVATDRGFCGALNANLFKYLLHFMRKKKDEGVQCDIAAWGRRAKQFCKKIPDRVVMEREQVLEKPRYELARDLADELLEKFLSGEYDRIYLAFVKFRSALSQSPEIVQLLPVGQLAGQEKKGETSDEGLANVLVEPDLATLVESLLKKEVASVVFRALLEGSASEHGARMTAMDSATNNADEVIRKLTIQYNRARQAYITKELIEITSGAEAL